MQTLIVFVLITVAIVSAGPQANPFRSCAGEPLPASTGHTCVVCKCNMALAREFPLSEICAWTLVDGLNFWETECRREVYRQFDARRSFSPFNMAFHTL